MIPIAMDLMPDRKHACLLMSKPLDVMSAKHSYNNTLHILVDVRALNEAMCSMPG